MQERKDDIGDLASRLLEAEQLLQSPAAAGHHDRAARLLISIARHAPRGIISNLAMQTLSLANQHREDRQPSAELNGQIEVLRRHIEQAADDVN